MIRAAKLIQILPAMILIHQSPRPNNSFKPSPRHYGHERTVDRAGQALGSWQTMTLVYYTALTLLIAAVANNYSIVRRFRALTAEKYPDHPELDSLSLLASPVGLVLNLGRLKYSRVLLEFPEQERKLLYMQRRVQVIIFVLFALSIFILALPMVG